MKTSKLMLSVVLCTAIQCGLARVNKSATWRIYRCISFCLEQLMLLLLRLSSKAALRRVHLTNANIVALPAVEGRSHSIGCCRYLAQLAAPEAGKPLTTILVCVCVCVCCASASLVNIEICHFYPTQAPPTLAFETVF